MIDLLHFLYKQNLKGKIRKKHEWKCVIESSCLVTSLQLVQARIIKKCQQEKILKEAVCSCIYIFGRIFLGEPFPHLKCENGSECGIGMDCTVLIYNNNN